MTGIIVLSCDLLENSYLCGISNNATFWQRERPLVVICLKIRTFVVSATTPHKYFSYGKTLWFAWKFVPLWYQQQRNFDTYLWNGVVICLKIRTFVVSATTVYRFCLCENRVVICLKIRTFVVSATTASGLHSAFIRCDLLENSYLCGISNNELNTDGETSVLWFAWKFVPLWYQQQRKMWYFHLYDSCDLLENSYLCGISNNPIPLDWYIRGVVICLKIRTFVVSATTNICVCESVCVLWFAWKFVPLWYQQQHSIVV